MKKIKKIAKYCNKEVRCPFLLTKDFLYIKWDLLTKGLLSKLPELECMQVFPDRGIQFCFNREGYTGNSEERLLDSVKNKLIKDPHYVVAWSDKIVSRDTSLYLPIDKTN